MDNLDILAKKMDAVNRAVVPRALETIRGMGIEATSEDGDLDQDAEIDLPKKGEIEFHVQVGFGYAILQSFDGEVFEDLAEGWEEIFTKLKEIYEV
jgi:hypothetical protein